MKHAFIVPLIGGQTLGQQAAFGSRPDYLLSYEPFGSNDSHLVNHYGKDTPYILLDSGGKHPHAVDVVGTTCPCAGLSSLSGHASSEAEPNKWMYETANYVLGEMKPQVFWGENAPGFAGKIGQPVVDKLYQIARENGYTMSIYRTKSLLHGVAQVRERSFYFFWRGNRTPIFEYFDKPRARIEDVLDSVQDVSFQFDVTNPRTPSKDDDFYRYVLEELEGGITHHDFYNILEKSDNPMDYLERKGKNYNEVGEWMKAKGLDRAAARCERIAKKLATGGNIMRRLSTIPKGHIGAFVGHYPTQLTHYKEDRYITYREAMAIMGLPNDFELLNPSRNLNHICQNVPVSTATDMAKELKAALEGHRDYVSSTLVYQYNASKTYEMRDPQDLATLDEFFA